MIIYIIFLIFTAIICKILCTTGSKTANLIWKTNCLEGNNKKPTRLLRFMSWLYHGDGAENIFIALFVLIAFGSPSIYEFPRFYHVGIQEGKEYEKNPVQPYMYIEDTSKHFYKKKLPTNGTFHSFNQSIVTKKISTGPILVTRVFRVYEEKQDRTVKFRIWIQGDDWSQFLLEIYNSKLDARPLKGDHNLIFDHLQKIFEDEDIGFEQFPDVAERIGNEWLKKNNINSVHISIRPNGRKVWVKK